MPSSRRTPARAAFILAIVTALGYERLAFSQDTERDRSADAGSGIALSNGRITMQASNRSLAKVLDDLATMQHEVAIVVIDRAAVDRPVTASFQAALIDEALRTLLDQEDVAMVYGGVGQGSSALTAVLIYPKGGGERLVGAARQEADVALQLAHALDSPDERIRGQAVQEAIERGGTRAEDVVLRALDDQSDYVRAVALSSALEAAFSLPVDTLVRLAIADPVASVRMNATQALGSNVEGIDATQRLNAIEEVASLDPDPSVRNRAAGLLQELTNPPQHDQGTSPQH